MSAKSRNNNQDHFDYAIIGGGCFGASTVLALKREWPDARVIWFEGTHKCTASRDTSKIVRAAYEDDDYVAFARKSLEMWATVDPYREFYHQTGWVQVVGEGSDANTIKGPNDRMVSIEEMQERVGSRKAANLAAGDELRLNEDIGYIDYDLAVEAVANEASNLGVIRVKKDVTKLTVKDGICLGVEVCDDRVMAGTIIVAAGPWTPGLLEKSQVVFPQDFFTVAGVGVATMPLADDEFEELKQMPILITEGGEVILSEKHRVLKITTTATFRIKHPDELADSISVGKNRAVLEKVLPQFTGRKLGSWICPDLMTPYQHPLVDRVPSTRKLYVAAGGSYHSAKFMPNIGGMTVRRLREQTGSDTVEGRLLGRWGWDRSKEKVAVHRSVIPRGN